MNPGQVDLLLRCSGLVALWTPRKGHPRKTCKSPGRMKAERLNIRVWGERGLATEKDENNPATLSENQFSGALGCASMT